MMQQQPNCMELRLKDSYIQILCGFQKSKQKVPPPSLHCKCLQEFTGTLQGFFCNICRENPVIFTDFPCNPPATCKYCRVFPANIAEKPLNHPGNIYSTSEEERAINQFYYFQCQGVQTVLHYIKAKAV